MKSTCMDAQEKYLKKKTISKTLKNTLPPQLHDMINNIDSSFRNSRDENILSSPTSVKQIHTISGPSKVSSKRKGNTYQKVKTNTINSVKRKVSVKEKHVKSKKVNMKHTASPKRNDSVKKTRLSLNSKKKKNIGNLVNKCKRKRSVLCEKVVKRSKPKCTPYIGIHVTYFINICYENLE